MTTRTRRILLNGGSFVLAIGLLYLALQGIDLAAVLDAFRKANYSWLAPLVAVVVISNGMRAWRWQVLMEALPEVSDISPKNDIRTKPSFEMSFSSIMIGYMVNYAAPRLGEFVRTANMKARTRLSFSGILGTVVIERILDTAILLFALVSGLLLISGRLPAIQPILVDPVVEWLRGLPVVWLIVIGVVTAGVLGGIGFLIHRTARNEQSSLRQFWLNTMQPALVSFKSGMRTLDRSGRPGILVLSTLGMWGGYLLMAYLPFVMLGIAEPYSIGLGDAWALMAIGALGLLVPSPGGIGSYHYITIQALVLMYGVPEAPAASYAVLAHAAQLIFYVVAGSIALVWQGYGLNTLIRRVRQRTDEMSEDEDEPAPSSTTQIPDSSTEVAQESR